MAQQTGFMGTLFDKNVANSTKCQTWRDVQEAHKDNDVAVSFDDTVGLLILLIVGLSAALVMFTAENGVFRHRMVCREKEVKKKEVDIGEKKGNHKIHKE